MAASMPKRRRWSSPPVPMRWSPARRSMAPRTMPRRSACCAPPSRFEPMTVTNTQIFPDAEALARHAAEFVTATLEAIPGPSAVALSGGSTPKRLYELLAAPPFRDRLPWARVHWFWGDERFVAQDDPQSNYRMTRLAMLD